MNFNNKKVLVTGADGFIGSHLTTHLRDLGADVRALCLYNSFSNYGWLDSVNTKNIELVMGDVRDPNGVRAAMQGVDIVFHLAALIAIPYSYVAPDMYVDTNVKGTLNIVQAARETGARVISTSTSEVYGTARFVPITEEHPLQGQSPYSATKIGADQLALSFHKAFETKVSIIRPFNTYGPRQSARAVIPTIITQIANGKREIKLGDINPTRDFNYVQDTVRGFVSVASSDKTIGEVVNIASNYEISVGDTVQMIAELMGAKIKIMTDTQRLRPAKSEVERLWGCNKKALDLCGWQPEYAGLEGLKRGLSETIEWFTNPKNLAHYKAEIYNV